MTATTHPRPVPFTRDDYAIRMARVTKTHERRAASTASSSHLVLTWCG